MKHSVAASTRRMALLLATTVVAVFGLTAVASAATYSVNDTTDAPLANPTDTNCVSTNTTTAFPGGTCTLRAAVQAANNTGGANTINLPSGTYNMTQDTEMDVNYPTDNGTSITLTGAGSASTIIDGQLNEIFYVAADGGLSMSGVTLQDGLDSYGGGAVYSDGALATTSDVVFLANSAADDSLGNASVGYGGAIYESNNASTSLSLNGASFIGNSGYYNGGAVFDDSPNPATVTNSTFEANSTIGCGTVYIGYPAPACGFDGGGAIAADNGNVSVDHSSFSTNLSANGGAVYYGYPFYGFGGARKAVTTTGPALSITNSSFTNNSAQIPYSFCYFLFASHKLVRQTQGIFSFCSGSGGAVTDYDSANTTLSNDQFTGNTATAGGALELDSGSSTVYTLSSNEFDGNSAKLVGGGVDWEEGDYTDSGSTYTGNVAAFTGGGLFADSGNLMTMVNDTLDGNRAPSTYGYWGGGLTIDTNTPVSWTNDTIAHNSGGGLAIYDSPGLELTNGTETGTGVLNTAIVNNVTSDCPANSVTGGAEVGNNADSDGSCFGSNAISTDKTNIGDAKLGAPADNGGPVLTDAELAGSPLIDAGTNTGCPATDARGITRPQGASCDIGAFELANAGLTLTKQATATATQYQPFTYTITAGNSGPGFSTTTTVNDQLPAGEVLIAASASQGNCSSTGIPAKVTCDLGNVPVGSSATVSIIVYDGQTGKVTNTATATNDQGANVNASATTTVAASAAKTGSKPSAVTGPAKNVKATSAKITGTVGTGGTRTEYFFEYGTSRSLGSISNPTTLNASSNVSAALAKLKVATRYYYRVVATNPNGTANGKIRSFKTGGKIGALLLDGLVLHVRGGKVYETFTCQSSIPCYFRFTITVRGRLAGTHTYPKIVFTQSKSTLKTISAGKTVTVSALVDPSALQLLQSSKGHMLVGTLSTGPRSGQKGIIKVVTVVLG